MDQKLLDKLCIVIGNGEHWTDDYCYIIRNNKLYRTIALTGNAWKDYSSVELSKAIYNMEQDFDKYEKND